jgi:heme/copper-type cytochrome/quinol oxidase subunit 1
MVGLAGFTGLVLATIIRLELAYPGQFFLASNAERYLTTISLHGVVMVFFVVIPALFGAFGNFLLPTQLGIRDVAFPRLNSFMFWVTPAGFVLLLHILFFDKNYNLTYWMSYTELRSRLRRRYLNVELATQEFRGGNTSGSILAWRLVGQTPLLSRGYLSTSIAPNVMAQPLVEFSPIGLGNSFTTLVGGVCLSTEIGGRGQAPSGSYRVSGAPQNMFWQTFGSKDSMVLGGQPSHLRSLTSELQNTHDYLMDWRTLKLEREIWRSLDFLSQARQASVFRRKFYTELFDPTSSVSKVSTWLPNQLLAGWAFVTPYSSRLRYTALGKVDIALVVVFMAALGSIFSSINYIITYRYIGAPILKNRRELRSFFVDALLVGSRMMVLANPALLIGILLLLSDRHFNTSVFDFSGGGDTVLFQHLFWFFGHPEVYIIIIPCFGFMNSLLPHYLRKRLSGRLSLQFSMYTIAFMGFAVWGHHMYMVGLANSVRTLYSTMTVMISVPASTKVLHWCVTLTQATLTLDVGFLFLISFMYFFVLGGLSGMFVAHIGFDTLFHDTFYVIGHFHVMLAGAAVSCIFAAFYFYFAALFGVRYSRFFAYLHYIFYTAGQLLTLIPMFWLGYAGMPRRIMDYPSAFGGWHSVVTSGHLLTVLSLVFFFCMLVDSFYENRAPEDSRRGVSRLNTRLGFYTYEARKLQTFQKRGLFLYRQNHYGTGLQLYGACYRLESIQAEYIFFKGGVFDAPCS